MTAPGREYIPAVHPQPTVPDMPDLTWKEIKGGWSARSPHAEYFVTRVYDPDCHALAIDGVVVLYGDPDAMKSVAADSERDAAKEARVAPQHEIRLAHAAAVAASQDEYPDPDDIPLFDMGDPVG